MESAEQLAETILKYTRTESNDENLKSDCNGKRWFWPLVKCVTIRVPNNDFLKHITLVDLPGSGDRNKSRDQMWKNVVANCSTVWIVTQKNRAAADRDAWEILENTCNLIGNGGECQNIYFICTKCDDDTCDNILKENQKAKDLVMKEFNKLQKVKKHFKEDCFKVFTVSSKEFFKPKKLKHHETEIPTLQLCLRILNDQHNQTLNYVRGAYGILSLIQGAKVKLELSQIEHVTLSLLRMIHSELEKVSTSMTIANQKFGNCLIKGVEKSKVESNEALKKKLNPKRKGGGRSFHKPLKKALMNNGINITKKIRINLNETISSFLTNSIDKEFREMFPNDAKSGPFYGAINAFTLDLKNLAQQYKQLELLLTFIETEVDKVKAKLCKNIRDRKKVIYSSLTETVQETMQEIYTEAAQFSGAGSLEKMKNFIEDHFCDVKDTMFDRAKDQMLTQLENLRDEVQRELKDTLMKSVDLSFAICHSFRADNNCQLSIADFTSEHGSVKKHLDDLMRENKEDLAWPH